MIKIKLNYFSFFTASLFGLLIAVSGYFILPARFFLDTNYYIYDPYNQIGLKGGYPLTILFYNLTGLKHLHFSLIGFIQYIVLIFILYKIGIPKSFGKINIKNLLIYFGFFMLAIFISMPSKEFITFIFISIIVFLFKKKKV